MTKQVKHSVKDFHNTLYGVTNWMKSFRGSITFLIAAFFILFPFLNDSIVFLGPLMQIMIFSIYAASWDFLAGFTGQGSFGHVIFLGVSIYAYSILVTWYSLPWWISLILGALIVAILAFLLGLPLQRMSGPYFALGTLGLGVIFQLLWMLPQMEFISGGTMGINVTPISQDIKTVYFVTMFFMVVSLIIMIAIGKSNMGTVLKAIRDDETGAKASGINVVKYKMIALIISAFFAGIAGGLWAQKNSGASMASFNFLYSFVPIIMVMMGGLTTISGALLGAFIWVIYQVIIDSVLRLPAVLANPALNQFLVASPGLIFAVIIIIILRFSPNGLMNPALDKLKKVWDLLAGK